MPVPTCLLQLSRTNFISFPISELALSYSVLVQCNKRIDQYSKLQKKSYISQVLSSCFVLYWSRFLVLLGSLNESTTTSSLALKHSLPSSNSLSTKQDVFGSETSQTQSYFDSLIMIITASTSYAFCTFY